MTTSTLLEVQQLIDQLSPLEQVRLLEYLTPRIRQTVSAMQPAYTSEENGSSSGWDTLFLVGDKIAALPNKNQITMTQAITEMRR